jgi:hypothetical protein
MAQTEDKKSYRLWIGKKTDKGEYYARAEGNDFLFTVGDWVIGPYEKPLKDFFDLAAPSSRPATGASSEATTRKDGDEPKK